MVSMYHPAHMHEMVGQGSLPHQHCSTDVPDASVQDLLHKLAAHTAAANSGALCLLCPPPPRAFASRLHAIGYGEQPESHGRAV